jgi:phosphonopyruvate decarboxylase
MIDTLKFFNSLKKNKIDFFTGVPDSLLKEFCFCVTENTNKSEHIINANEGSSIGLSVGYNLATNKIPLVYFQNSGLGNIINPFTSIVHESVFKIPILLFIGWRGEPGKKDEPQHIFQGKITEKILEALEIEYEILNTNTSESITQVERIIKKIEINQKPIAILVKKNSFSKYSFKSKESKNNLKREKCIQVILDKLKDEDVLVSTTGKTSRELYELSERNKLKNPRFLSIGGMGHVSQISLGISNNSSKRVFCLDGDGSIIMHMGSMGIIGDNAGSNYFHILFNNGTHESVGGQPTIGGEINFELLSVSLGYESYFKITYEEQLLDFFKNTLNSVKGPVFIEILIDSSSRQNLGRPKDTPLQQKEKFTKLFKNQKGE